MKYKLSLLLLIHCCIFNSFAQKQFALPTQKEWADYFFSKEKTVRTKLYELALSGTIKAYKNDSLKTCFNLDELKARGSNEIASNEDEIVIPMNPDNLEHILFTKKINTSPFETTEINQLQGIAITYSPFIGFTKLWSNPFCWFSPNDVKKNLTPEEYNWLCLIFHYSKYNHNLAFQFSGDFDHFWEINHVNNSLDINKADSLLYKKLSISLNTSNFYMDFLLNYNTYVFPDTIPVLIHDLQTKKNINLYKFETTYHDEIAVFISTDPKDPTIGYDSLINIPFQLNHISSLTVNTNTFKITSFNYEFAPKYPPKTTYRFLIDAEAVRKLNDIPAVFWFFEDYFRWKLK